MHETSCGNSHSHIQGTAAEGGNCPQQPKYILSLGQVMYITLISHMCTQCGVSMFLLASCCAILSTQGDSGWGEGVWLVGGVCGWWGGGCTLINSFMKTVSSLWFLLPVTWSHFFHILATRSKLLDP